MSRYIAVIHGWFVDSNGFSVHEIEASDKQEANEKACYLNEKRNSTFDKCAYTVLEIGTEETFNRTRKLTWRERLTGWNRQ